MTIMAYSLIRHSDVKLSKQISIQISIPATTPYYEIVNNTTQGAITYESETSYIDLFNSI